MITRNGTKRCSDCKQEKATDLFSRDGSRADGFDYICKECRRVRQSGRNRPERKLERTATERRLERNAKMRAYKAKRRDKVNESHRRYRATNRDKIEAYVSDRERTHPLAIQAKNKVNNAINEGKMPSVKTRSCADCGGQAQHYHHESYEPEHWLDAVPLCVSCHKKRHAKPPVGL